MKDKILQNKEFEFLKDYDWIEIEIGCSNTFVYKLEKDDEVLFLKVGEVGVLTNEHKMLDLLKNYIKIPNVVKYYKDEYEVIITTEMKGKMSCDDDLFEYEDMVLNCVVDAIKQIQNVKLNDKLKENLKVFNLDKEIETIKQRIKAKEITEIPDKKVFDRFKSLDEVVAYLEENKPDGELYFSHGDVSLPNVFIDDNKFSGFIDIGNAGIRQKWYDIADAYVSVRRNFETQEAADRFLNKLEVDKENVEYYEMLICLS